MISVKQVKEEIKKTMQLFPSNDAVKNILKHDMDLIYKKISHQGEYVNKQQNIDLRQKFAIEILRQLKFGKIIINFDESIIEGTCSSSFSWERKGRT